MDSIGIDFMELILDAGYHLMLALKVDRISDWQKKTQSRPIIEYLETDEWSYWKLLMIKRGKANDWNEEKLPWNRNGARERRSARDYHGIDRRKSPRRMTIQALDQLWST